MVITCRNSLITLPHVLTNLSLLQVSILPVVVESDIVYFSLWLQIMKALTFVSRPMVITCCISPAVLLHVLANLAASPSLPARPSKPVSGRRGTQSYQTRPSIISPATSRPRRRSFCCWRRADVPLSLARVCLGPPFHLFC